MISSRNFFSPLISGMHVATSGMKAQNERILTISENLANAGTRAPKGGQPYQRKVLSFKSQLDKKLGAEVIQIDKISRDTTSPIKLYSPSNPAADSEGFVYESNVQPLVELADLREAGRGYEANLKVFEQILSMLQNAVSLMKPV